MYRLGLVAVVVVIVVVIVVVVVEVVVVVVVVVAVVVAVEVVVVVDRSCRRISVGNGSSGIRTNIGSSSSGRMPRKISIWGLNAIEEVK